MAEVMPRPLSARELFAALVEAGVFRADDRYRRVLIELDAGTDLVTIHAGKDADDRLLKVVPKLTRALINTDGGRKRRMT